MTSSFSLSIFLGGTQIPPQDDISHLIGTFGDLNMGTDRLRVVFELKKTVNVSILLSLPLPTFPLFSLLLLLLSSPICFDQRLYDEIPPLIYPGPYYFHTCQSISSPPISYLDRSSLCCLSRLFQR
jgi:hypothetical protein